MAFQFMIGGLVRQSCSCMCFKWVLGLFSSVSLLCRVGIATRNGLPILIRVLAAVENLESISTDAISSTLRMLIPQSDELGCQVRNHRAPLSLR